MPSAIASQPIVPGAAVAQAGDIAANATPILTATHIAQTGTPKGGIVTLLASGTLTLVDWTLATGSQYLVTGAVYFVGASGKLIANGSGQPIGVAVSKTTLSITIQNQTGASNTNDIASLQAQIDALNIKIKQMSATMTSFVGSFSIGNNTDTGTVTGLGLQFTPTRVFAVVRKPANGLNLHVTIVQASISNDGFTFYLNALTDSASYVLDYQMI